MDQLLQLLNAPGPSGHSPKEMIQRAALKGALAGVFGLAWAIVLVGMIALTAVLALEPEVGAAPAAAITTGGLVLVGAVAALMLRGGSNRSAQTAAPTAASAQVQAQGTLSQNGDVLRVRNGWDVATLVALGILSGLQQRRQH